MPAPGPSGTWYDDFLGNKRNYKWVSKRYSQGGQNTGVWLTYVKDSKLYWTGVDKVTEGSWWGETISLPVNAPGDIIIEASMRIKYGGNYCAMALGINDPGTLMTNYGIASYSEGLLKTGALNATAGTPFPGFPSMTQRFDNYTDFILNYRIVRKNGYAFLYANGTFIGQYAYANLITTVDICFKRHAAGNTTGETWCDWISVYPREVVL